MVSSFPAGTVPARGFDWNTVVFPGRRVGDFADLLYGKGLVDGKRHPGNVPVFGTNGQCGWHDQALRPGPGVILGRKGQGPLGVEWCDIPFWVIDTAYVASVDSVQADQKWFYYITKYVGLNHLKSGEKPGLQRDTFRAQVFPFPDKPVQQAIASVLSALDDKIHANHKTNRALEALASALFKSWFVDFDPVVAKRDGKTPIGVPADALDFFPSHFQDTELGPIPKEWRVAHVEDAFDVNPKRNLSPGVVAPYLEMANVPTVGHSPDTWIMREAGSGMRFTNGDTLIARITPCLENGKTAFVDFLAPGEVGWGSTEFLVVRSKPPLPLVASYLLARDDSLRAYAVQGMTGSSGRQRVAADVLGRYALAMPDDKVATVFGDIVEPLFEMARRNSAESRTLRDIRDVLLAPLLAGEITLKAAEKTVAQVF